jgi:organic hydroperoxide reductase OsmC/OhrA
VIAITKNGDPKHRALPTCKAKIALDITAIKVTSGFKFPYLTRHKGQNPGPYLLGQKEKLAMGSAHRYRVVAWWSAGRSGLAKSDSAPNAIHFTAPPEFGGLDGRWTPEDLLLCAVASCYTTTFRALADYSALEYSDLGVEVEGRVSKADSGYAFSEMVIRPKLSIASAEEQARAVSLLHKAKAVCLVSRALAVPQVFEPLVQVREPRGESGHNVPAEK